MRVLSWQVGAKVLLLAALLSGCADEEPGRDADAGGDTDTDAGSGGGDADGGRDLVDEDGAADGADEVGDSSDEDGLVSDAAGDSASDGDADGPELMSEVAVTIEVDGARWQRRYVTLPYAIDEPAGSYTVNVSYAIGGEQQPATPLAGYGDGAGPVGAGAHTFVWDSAADVAGDEDGVVLRVEATRVGATSTGWATSAPFELPNALDSPRVLLMTSSINGNMQVRRLVYDPAGGAIAFDDEDVLTVAVPPAGVVFDPGGRAAFLVPESGEALVRLGFASPGGEIDEEDEIPTPDHSFWAAQVADDSSALYLLEFAFTDFGGGIYRLALDPWTAEPMAGASPELVVAVQAASAFALVPAAGGMLALGTSSGDERGGLRLQWFDLAGEAVDDVFLAPVDSSAEALAVSEDGRWVLAVWSNLFTGEGGAALLEMDGQSLAAASGNEVTLSSPSHGVFGPDGGSALVAQIDPDRVIGLAVGEEGTLAVVDQEILGLAEGAARMRLGSDADLVFVTTVHPIDEELGSGVGRLRLGADGMLTAEAPYYIGPGIERIPSGVAIQP